MAGHLYLSPPSPENSLTPHLYHLVCLLESLLWKSSPANTVRLSWRRGLTLLPPYKTLRPRIPGHGG